MKENVVNDMDHQSYNSGIAIGIAAAFNEYVPKIPDEKERKWILEQIEVVVFNCRTDEGDEITFNKKCFSEEDYVEENIEMLSGLYSKMKNINWRNGSGWKNE